MLKPFDRGGILWSDRFFNGFIYFYVWREEDFLFNFPKCGFIYLVSATVYCSILFRLCDLSLQCKYNFFYITCMYMISRVNVKYHFPSNLNAFLKNLIHFSYLEFTWRKQRMLKLLLCKRQWRRFRQPLCNIKILSIQVLTSMRIKKH